MLASNSSLNLSHQNHHVLPWILIYLDHFRTIGPYECCILYTKHSNVPQWRLKKQQKEPSIYIFKVRYLSQLKSCITTQIFCVFQCSVIFLSRNSMPWTMDVCFKLSQFRSFLKSAQMSSVLIWDPDPYEFTNMLRRLQAKPQQRNPFLNLEKP